MILRGAHVAAEERAQARVDLARKAPPAVEPRHDDAALERALQLRLEHVERAVEPLHALQGQVVGGHRDEDAVGRDERVQRQHAERGAAVDQDGAIAADDPRSMPCFSRVATCGSPAWSASTLESSGAAGIRRRPEGKVCTARSSAASGRKKAHVLGFRGHGC